MLVSIWLITTTKTFFPTAPHVLSLSLSRLMLSRLMLSIWMLYMKIDSRKIFHHHHCSHSLCVCVRACAETTESLLLAFSPTRLFYMQIFKFTTISHTTYSLSAHSTPGCLRISSFFRAFEFLTENHQRNKRGNRTIINSNSNINNSNWVDVCVEGVW